MSFLCVAGVVSPAVLFLSLYEWHQAITANDVNLACTPNNCVAIGAIHTAVAAFSWDGSWCCGACVTAVGSNGNHLILGNGAVHFNVPQIVCVVKHELQHPVSRFGGTPTVFFGTVNNQAVIFGGLLELSVVVYSIV